MLQADLFKFGSRRGVKLGPLTAVTHIDAVHIVHEIHGPLSANVLIKGAAEIVGDVVFAVRKSAGTAKSAHN